MGRADQGGGFVSRPRTIYALKDPFTDKVRYVGGTWNSIEKRLAGHIGEARTSVKRDHDADYCNKHTWICGLMKMGRKPLIVALETIDTEAGPSREAFWIEKMIADGCELFNVSLVNESTKIKPDPMPIPPVTIADVRALVAAWHDSQARGGVSVDFRDALTGLATRSGLPVPEFHGVLDGVRETKGTGQMSEGEDRDRIAADGESACCAGSPTGQRPSLVCTKPDGHDGDHVGHGSSDQELGRWPQ